MRDLIQVGQIIDELVRRANADPRDYQPWGDRFYRESKRRTRRRKKPFIKPRRNFVRLEAEQMSLFPCSDLFSENIPVMPHPTLRRRA